MTGRNAIRELDNDSLRGRVLVVDDDVMITTSLRALLSQQGYDVFMAHGGLEALRILDHDPNIDVMLLDLSMPGMGGFEVMDAIIERELEVAIIVVSGDKLSDSLPGALERGAYDFVRKPYASVELMATVRNAIRKREFTRLHREMSLKLLQSERLHRFLVQHSPEIVFVLDGRYEVKFVNDRITEILGFRANELVGKAMLEIVETEDRGRLLEFFQSISSVADETPLQNEFCLLTAETSRNKRYFEISAYAAQTRVPEGSSPLEFAIYGTAREITDRKLADEMMSFHSFHDPLTRLPSRALFRDRLSSALQRAVRQVHPLYVMFIDLDGFKAVNDNLGHAIGDQLLRAISSRVLRIVRSTDTLARFGGDEFTLLLVDAESITAAVQVGEKVLAEVMKPFELDGHNVKVGASIGIAAFPDHGDSAESLLRHADIAMYFVKTHGKNNVRVFSSELLTTQGDRAGQDAILHGLERLEFDVYFQPIISFRLHRAIGLEALTRWNNPTRGLLIPEQFLLGAEPSEVFGHLDLRNLHLACQQLLRLDQLGNSDLRVVVNISDSFFSSPHFAREAIEAVKSAGLNPQRVEFDISERLLLKATGDMLANLREINLFGIRISIEHFGSGYTSLALLQLLPLNSVKIPTADLLGALNRKSSNHGLMIAALAIAKDYGLDLIATEIETTEQMLGIEELGCEYGQGYRFAAPMPSALLSDALTRSYP